MHTFSPVLVVVVCFVVVLFGLIFAFAFFVFVFKVSGAKIGPHYYIGSTLQIMLAPQFHRFGSVFFGGGGVFCFFVFVFTCWACQGLQ